MNTIRTGNFFFGALLIISFMLLPLGASADIDMDEDDYMAMPWEYMGMGYGMDYGPHHRMGSMGVMGPPTGMMDPMIAHRMGMGPLGMLDLSDDQRKKIRELPRAKRKQHWEIMDQIMDKRAALYDLYSEDQLDPKKIGAAYGEIYDLKRRLIESKIETMNQIRGALNDDQREQLRDMRRHRHMMGRRDMMGPMGR